LVVYSRYILCILQDGPKRLNKKKPFFSKTKVFKIWLLANNFKKNINDM
jgi:hypothetical protein